MYNRIKLKPGHRAPLAWVLALPWLAVVGLALDFPGWPVAVRCFLGLLLLVCALRDGRRLALRDGISQLRLSESGLAVEQRADGHWRPARIAHASRLFGNFVILRLRVLEPAGYRSRLLILTAAPGLANIDPDQMRELRTWLHLNPPPHTMNQPQ